MGYKKRQREGKMDLFVEVSANDVRTITLMFVTRPANSRDTKCGGNM